MLDAKLIGVVILVVALIGGGIWWAKSGSAVPDPEVLEKGVKNLTRDNAAAKIKEYLQLNPQMSNQYLFDEKLGHYHLTYVREDSPEVKILRGLVQAGYVKIASEKSSYGTLDIAFDFTDQAKSYVKRQSYGTYDSLITATVVSVEVTGITEPTQGPGGNSKVANATATYEQNAIGKIVFPDWKAEPVKSQIPFVLYDDGWRIGF